MLKKKIEVVELNKKEEKIILEEKQSKFGIFWKKYGKIIYITALIISLTILILGVVASVANLYSTDTPTIKEVSIDTSLNASNENIIFGNIPLTEETAKNSFLDDGMFKRDGEILLTKKVEAGSYTIKFYSDGTAIKIMKNRNIITRVGALENGDYGIKENGVINTKANIRDITRTNTKKFNWGTVIYYSDGSAEIINSKIDMFVRNGNDIFEKYISNNKVSYLKETKTYGNVKLDYYYDGTIEVIKGNKRYVVRNEKDIKVSKNNVTFPNNNQAELKNTLNLHGGQKISYYKDGSAIIRDGSKTISVRKSNSIILKDNKIFEIVDNIYVTVSNTLQNGNIIYYTNGSAVIKQNGQTKYVPENSNIKYQNNSISKIDNEDEVEFLTQETNIDKEKVQVFENTSVIKTDKYIAIIPKDNVIYDETGKIKEILSNTTEGNQNEFTIQNNTNSQLKYRIVIEQSNKTDLDIEYIRYQITAGSDYVEPSKMIDKLWPQDDLATSLGVKNKTYILLDGVIEAHRSSEVKLMLWTDYETIPNSMQNKYFYGTIKIYAWTEE